MTDTQWADTSQFQVPVDDSYPYRWFAFRMCNGDGPDTLGAQNYAWCQSAVARGALDGFFAYTVFYWDSNWAQNLIDEIGPNPHPNLVVMIDVESWNGYNHGDCSANLNAGVQLLAAHLGDVRRVVGYGNASDLDNLWPDKSALAPNHLIYANYDANPGYPGAFAHQYTDAGPCAPFGTCDMNSADGYDSAALQALLGIPAGPVLAGTGTSTPFSGSTEEIDMTPDQSNKLDAVYSALFGPANLGVKEMTWTNPDGPRSALYGTLDIDIYTQQLVANLSGQVAGVLAAVQQIGAAQGTTLDTAAITAAAEAGAKAALAGLTLKAVQ